MPRSLHAKLAALAERDGVSLNSLITSTLESAAKERDEGVPGGARPSASAKRSQTRFFTVALVVNFVVVALAAAIAIALLVTAWRHGW
jgi:HicB family